MAGRRGTLDPVGEPPREILRGKVLELGFHWNQRAEMKGINEKGGTYLAPI